LSCGASSLVTSTQEVAVGELHQNRVLSNDEGCAVKALVPKTLNKKEFSGFVVVDSSRDTAQSSR
jgi:hypothetical protein